MGAYGGGSAARAAPLLYISLMIIANQYFPNNLIVSNRFSGAFRNDMPSLNMLYPIFRM